MNKFKNNPFLQLIYNGTTSHRLRYNLVKESSKENLRTLLEIIINIYRGYLPISRKAKEDLETYRTELHNLTHLRTSNSRKRQLLLNNYKLLLLLLKFSSRWYQALQK